MPLRWLMIGLLLTCDAVAVFNRPSEYECRRALGNLFELPEAMRPLFEPDRDFRPVLPPGPRDWLTLHNETGQTFDEYRETRAIRPDATRRVIYLLPLGEFPEETAPDMERVRAYAAAFYQMPVRLLPAHFPHDLEFSPRKNPRGGHRQVLAPDVMTFLKSRLPADSHCLLGVTMTDLYPQPSWNYVFGQASLVERVGIFSLARYDPAFWREERGTDYHDVILQRTCKVLVHETAHMFGLEHCVYYECVVNGSNHLVETDAQPHALCVVCPRKIQYAADFDPARRYRELGELYRKWKWWDELDFVNRQLARLPATPAK